MASDLHVPVGTVPGYGGDIEVCRHPDGSAAIWTGFGNASVSVPPESVAALAELLDRAAMPGQAPGGHPLVMWAQDVARAEDRALEARDG